jgi:hypothetical protein
VALAQENTDGAHVLIDEVVRMASSLNSSVAEFRY